MLIKLSFDSAEIYLIIIWKIIQSVKDSIVNTDLRG